MAGLPAFGAGFTPTSSPAGLVGLTTPIKAWDMLTHAFKSLRG